MCPNCLACTRAYAGFLQPGSDLFFVYTHNWQNDPRGLVTVSRGATTKINYIHRF